MFRDEAPGADVASNMNQFAPPNAGLITGGQPKPPGWRPAIFGGLEKTMEHKDHLREWLARPNYALCACVHCAEHVFGPMSPIENMMLNALRFVSIVPSWRVLHVQWPIRQFAADIYLESSGHGVPFVVECDGHDFHERTKHQAQRDRSRDRTMQADGITVVRFTGSEIWRNPFACAEELESLVVGADVAIDLAREREGSSGA